MIDVSKIKIVKLSKIYDLSSFDCGDEDLNDFIRHDALKKEAERLASTFLIIYEENTVAGFFSLVNDGIKLKQDEQGNEGVPKLLEYPATKIARLATQKGMQKQGIGTLMVKLAIGMVLSCKHGASRFLTVDAYQNNVDFYAKKFKFQRNQHQDYTKKQDYVSMRFDLLNPAKEIRK